MGVDTPPDHNSRESRPGLPVELHAATREKHHDLNVQITARLPLCLSPSVSNPLLYAKGMVVFGQIYYSFEYHLIMSLAEKNLDERLRVIYQEIRLPALLRTTRLENDIDSLKSLLGPSAAVEIDILVEESKGFGSRIRASLSTKPHVLLAYAWAMYLALFNGGRWIQRQLASTGPTFWCGETPALSFWDFEDDDTSVHSDSTGLKQAFKDALSVAGSHLTDDEKDDVIEEAEKLFDLCLEMVFFLDKKVAAQPLTGHWIPQAIVASLLVQGYAGATSSIAFAWDYARSAYGSLRTTKRTT